MIEADRSGPSFKITVSLTRVRARLEKRLRPTWLKPKITFRLCPGAIVNIRLAA